MTLDVFVLVLGAAIVHALWNTLVKTDGDRLSVIKIMSATQLIVSLVLIPFVDTPPAASWFYVAASAALNTGYILLLHSSVPTLIEQSQLVARNGLSHDARLQRK
jgi:hypothetical protein